MPELPEKPTFEDKLDALGKANAMHERIRLFNDKAFYTIVIFSSREQVVAFVKAMGWEDAESFGNPHLLDGRIVASKEKISLPRVDEKLLHAAYARRRTEQKWPEGITFFDETQELDWR